MVCPSVLLENGLEVTALHNHFFWDEPRVFFMHVHGMGTPAALATKLKPALALIGKLAPTPATTTPAPKPGFDSASIAKIAGHQGDTTGAVYKITVGRDDLSIKDWGTGPTAKPATGFEAALDQLGKK